MLYSGNLPDNDEITSSVHDEARLKAVRAADDPDQRRSPAFDRLSKEAAELLEAPLALISLVEYDKDIIYGQSGLPSAICDAGYIGIQPSFCQLTIASKKPVVIDDAREVPTLRLFPSVAQLGVRAHLGIPLWVDGQPIGNCCVLDFKPRKWTEADVANLKALAAQALDQFRPAKQDDAPE